MHSKGIWVGSRSQSYPPEVIRILKFYKVLFLRAVLTGERAGAEGEGFEDDLELFTGKGLH